MENAITVRADCYAAPMDAAPITFIELSGPGARDELATVATRATERGSRCELLVSEAQGDLYLLVCRGGEEPPAPPEDARAWSFRPVEVPA